MQNRVPTILVDSDAYSDSILLRFLSATLLLTALILAGCQNPVGPTKEPEMDFDGQSESDNSPVTIIVLRDKSPSSLQTENNSGNASDLQESLPLGDLSSLGDTIKKEFASLDLGTATVIAMDGDEFLKSPPAGDLVIFPPHRFGDLFAKRLLRTIPDYVVDSESYRRSDVFRHQRQLFGLVDGERYAVSNGTPFFSLLVREDILEQAGLEVPTTWSEFEKACEVLQEMRLAGEITVPELWSPSIEPFQNSWKARTFIARSAACIREAGRYSTVFKYSTWQPLIDTLPFQRSLEELTAAVQRMDPQHAELTPARVEQAFLNGECAMAITWPHPTMVDSDETGDLKGARIYPLPGSKRNFDQDDQKWVGSDPAQYQIPTLGTCGQCLAILRSTNQSGVAARRLGLLVNKQFSERLATSDFENGFPCRASQLAKLDSWADPRYPQVFLDQFADLVEEANQADVWMLQLQVARATDYEAALTKAIEEFVAGKSESPQSALQSVSDAWSEINQAVDIELQKKINLAGFAVQ